MTDPEAIEVLKRIDKSLRRLADVAEKQAERDRRKTDHVLMEGAKPHGLSDAFSEMMNEAGDLRPKHE